MSAQARGSNKLWIGDVILDGGYDFDSLGKNAGAPDAALMTPIGIGGGNRNEVVALTLKRPPPYDAAECEEFGLFAALPEPPWLEPRLWVTTLPDNTDGSGDMIAWVVARPGTSGADCLLNVNGAGVNADLYVRRASVGALSAVAE